VKALCPSSRVVNHETSKRARAAIQNAASVAALLITTEAMIAGLPKKNADGPAMPPGGGMDFQEVPASSKIRRARCKPRPFFWADPIPSSRQCAQAQAGCPVGGKGFSGIEADGVAERELWNIGTVTTGLTPT